MSDVLDSFIDKKKAESPYISLADGESVRVSRLKDIRIVTKAGFGGEEKEVLRLACIVDTVDGLREKSFDNGTQRFAQEMQEKGLKIGASFVITRNGTQTKTRYTLSEVVMPSAAVRVEGMVSANPSSTNPPAHPGMASVGQVIADKPKIDGVPA